MNEPLLRKDFDRIRHEMVAKAIVGRGVRPELVLDAIGSVPREAFLPAQLRERIENSFGKKRCRLMKHFPVPAFGSMSSGSSET